MDGKAGSIYVDDCSYGYLVEEKGLKLNDGLVLSLSRLWFGGM